jgi:hypothetical protein
MIYFREDCIRMVVERTAILIADGCMKNGSPVIAARMVQDFGGFKMGRDSRWCVTFKEPLSDGCDGCSPECILGTWNGKELDTARLNSFIYRQYSFLDSHEKEMLFSDAIARLKDIRP